MEKEIESNDGVLEMGTANIGWLNEPTKHYARDAGSVALPACACQVSSDLSARSYVGVHGCSSFLIVAERSFPFVALAELPVS
jgi:hypothetical protein